MIRMRAAMGAASIALCVLLAAPLGAQTLRGRILDSTSGEPVMLAYVGLMAEGRNLVVAGLASTEGEFALEAPDEGSYFIYVARTGYETLMDGVFELGDGGVFEVQIGLKPAPIAIAPVTVEARGPVNALEAHGFYDRAVSGRGTFMIREDIQRVAVDRLSDAFRQIPRLDVDTSRPLIGGPDVMQNPAIWVWRGGQQCAPTLYIDRHVVASGATGAVRLDDYVTAPEVDAIEVYTRSSEVPVEFDEINNCGVILIWTRTR